MKTTIIFLCLLVAVSSTTKMSNSYDPVLLQFHANPQAQAVLATMAVQLKQEGGFDRVLALLNELVEDGRKQLHEANKLWRKTEARCDVSTMKFAERQAFYVNRNTYITEHIAEATREGGVAAETASFLEFASKEVSTLLEKVVARHVLDRQDFVDYSARLTQTVAHIDEATASVANWTSAAFVQTALKKVTNSYLQVKSFQIVIPQSFVQMAADDQTVRQRIVEWLSTLRVTLLEDINASDNELVRSEALWTKIETEGAALVAQYTQDITHANSEVQAYTDSVKADTEVQNLLTQLTSDSEGLVLANNNYCSVERTNFTAAKDHMNQQLEMFRDIREYFLREYSNINRFVKEKFSQ